MSLFLSRDIEKLAEGLKILSEYFDTETDKISHGIILVMIDKPLSEDDVERLIELGWDPNPPVFTYDGNAG